MALERVETKTADLLAQIAGVIGCPVTTFFNKKSDEAGTTGASELLSLWVAISSSSGRAKVLATARAVLASQENQQQVG